MVTITRLEAYQGQREIQFCRFDTKNIKKFLKGNPKPTVFMAKTFVQPSFL